MHLYSWAVLTAILVRSISGTPLQIENTLVPPATSNISTLTENEINTDHYNVAGSNIWLQVLRPYGASFPTQPTLAFLNNTVTALAEVIADIGDSSLGHSYTRVERAIKIYIQVVTGMNFAMSTAKSAIQGIYELMSETGGVGTRGLTVFVNDQTYGIIGRIIISWDRFGSETAPVSNKAPAPTSGAAGTTNGPEKVDSESVFVSRAPTNMTGAVAPGVSTNLTSPLTPDHYRVPGTDVYVEVVRPYGAALPRDLTIDLLLSAAYKLSDDRRAQGDVLLPMEWSMQKHSLSVGFKSRSFNRPHLFTMQAGIVGLIDLMEEDSVVGTKDVTYMLGVEEQGGAGYGWVKWVDPHSVNGGNGTTHDVAVAATAASLAPSKVLGMAAVESQLIGTE